MARVGLVDLNFRLSLRVRHSGIAGSMGVLFGVHVVCRLAGARRRRRREEVECPSSLTKEDRRDQELALRTSYSPL